MKQNGALSSLGERKALGKPPAEGEVHQLISQGAKGIYRYFNGFLFKGRNIRAVYKGEICAYCGRFVMGGLGSEAIFLQMLLALVKELFFCIVGNLVCFV